MMSKNSVLVKLALSLVAVGSLSLAGMGMAGAAMQSDNTAPSSQHNESHSSAHVNAICVAGQRHIAFSQNRQSKFAAKTKGFAALEAKADKAGHTKRAAYWARVVARRTAFSNRMNVRLQARIARTGQAYGTTEQGCTQSHSGSDGGSDGGSHSGSDGGSDGGSHSGSDSGSHSGSDSGSHSGSDGGSQSGSHSGSHSGSDSGSQSGSRSGSDSGSTHLRTS